MGYLDTLKFKFSLRTGRSPNALNRLEWDVSHAASNRRHKEALDGGMMGGMQMFINLMERKV